MLPIVEDNNVDDAVTPGVAVSGAVAGTSVSGLSGHSCGLYVGTARRLFIKRSVGDCGTPAQGTLCEFRAARLELESANAVSMKDLEEEVETKLEQELFVNRSKSLKVYQDATSSEVQKTIARNLRRVNHWMKRTVEEDQPGELEGGWKSLAEAGHHMDVYVRHNDVF